VIALKTSFWVYPLVNALHILAIGATVTCVLLMDLRMLGRAALVERAPLMALMREGIAIAFPVAVLTGLALFSIRAQQYATNPAFLAKMAMLVLAGLNLLAFRLAVTAPGEGEDYPAVARMLAALSIALWVAILVAGRMIGFI
jgi:hypothetical protein